MASEMAVRAAAKICPNGVGVGSQAAQSHIDQEFRRQKRQREYAAEVIDAEFAALTAERDDLRRIVDSFDRGLHGANNAHAETIAERDALADRVAVLERLLDHATAYIDDPEEAEAAIELMSRIRRALKKEPSRDA